ncbi:MAG TPA: PspC domain-containing protein [Mycobacteriales bacterium]|nr:PspC domain-containing protein [Mycobacteriales bacterium]
MSTHLHPPTTGRPQRSTTNRMVAGVAGGLAEYARVDPLLIRVVFAILSVFGGLGVVIYGVCWLLLPREDERHSIGAAALQRGRSGGTVITAITLVIAVTVTGTFVWSGRFSDLALLILVLGAAVYLYRRRDEAPPAETAPAEPAADYLSAPDIGTASMAAVDAEADRIATEQIARESMGLPDPVPEPKQRERSLLTPIVLSALVIFYGAAVAAGGWLTIREYLAIGLGILGAGVLISTFYGRAIGLILVGIPLTAALAISSLIPMTAHGGYGTDTWRPPNIRSIDRNYQLNAGSMLLDLSNVDFRSNTVDTHLKLGIGRAEVTVPPDVDVTVDGKASGGELRIMGHETNGPRISSSRTDLGSDGRGGGTLHIKADLGFGQLVVHRAAA